MNKNQALQIARSSVEQEGWVWTEPVHVYKRREFFFFGEPKWYIRTNDLSRGCNVLVIIEDRTGKVVEKKILPR